MYKKFTLLILLVSVLLQKQTYAKTENLEEFLKEFYEQSNNGFHHTKLVVQERVNKTIIQNSLSIELMTLKNELSSKNGENIDASTYERIDYIRESFKALATDTNENPLWEAYFYNLDAQLDVLEINVSENNIEDALKTLDQILDSVYFINKEEV